jgi:lysozyme family protein
MILAGDIIEGILAVEKLTFTDRPDDKGGPTCCGVTLATYAAFRAPLATTVEDLKRMTPQIARQVYQHVFIDAPRFGEIADLSLQALIVDAGVQHGTEEATKMLQRAVGEQLRTDGDLGEISLRAVNSHDPHPLRARVCAARIRLYGSLVAHDPKLAQARAAGFYLQADNALGWANRIAQFVETIT